MCCWEPCSRCDVRRHNAEFKAINSTEPEKSDFAKGKIAESKDSFEAGQGGSILETKPRESHAVSQPLPTDETPKDSLGLVESLSEDAEKQVGPAITQPVSSRPSEIPGLLRFMTTEPHAVKTIQPLQPTRRIKPKVRVSKEPATPNGWCTIHN